MSLSIQNIAHYSNVSQKMILIELKVENPYQVPFGVNSDEFEVKGEQRWTFYFSFNDNQINLLLYNNNYNVKTMAILKYTVVVFDAEGKSLIARNLSPDSTEYEDKESRIFEFLSHFQIRSPVHFPLTINCSIVTDSTNEEKAQVQNGTIPVQDINKEVELNQSLDKERKSAQNIAKEVATETNASDNMLECFQELSVSLKKLLDQAIGTDITIHVGGVTMSAHKMILRTRSPVFEKMFDHDTSEAAQNEIDIKDIRAPIMKELLTFLYTGAIENHDFDDACDLYYAADKYEVMSLRNACAKDLLCLLQVDNACQVLILAINHGDESFKEKILKYIMANIKEIMSTKSFEELAKYDANLVVLLMRKAFT